MPLPRIEDKGVMFSLLTSFSLKVELEENELPQVPLKE